MKIAIIGSGVSGLGAAYALSDRHDIRLFEAAYRLGGHANTVEVDTPEGRIAVDTGFIVFNEVNYPNLCGLFDHLGTPSKTSDMSFGFSLDGGRFEYACDNFDKIFAQRGNILRPAFWSGLREVLRFVKRAPEAYDRGEVQGVSLLDWLDREGFSDRFRRQFILPMAGAIWSTPSDEMGAFPAENFIRFFKNHDLFTGLSEARKWRTVDGGSKLYVDEIARRLAGRVETGRPVLAVRRTGDGVEVVFQDGRRESFDQVVMAVHGPDAHRMLVNPDAEESRLLSAFRTTRNRAVLHSDPALMPRRRKVWSSWSMLCDSEGGDRPVTLSYWMNRLQSLPTSRDLFVTLNADADPAPEHFIAEFDYAHPYFDAATFEAQAGMDAIQGRGGVWYAGAWLGWGFHEDGLRSALRVAEALRARPTWARDTGAPLVAPAAFGIAAQ